MTVNEKADDRQRARHLPVALILTAVEAAGAYAYATVDGPGGNARRLTHIGLLLIPAAVAVSVARVRGVGALRSWYIAAVTAALTAATLILAIAAYLMVAWSA